MNFLYFVWSVDPTIFSIDFGFFVFQLRYYSLMFLLGFLISYQMLKWFYKIEKRSEDDFSSLLTYIVLGTIIGARLGHVLFYQPDYYFSNPSEIFLIYKGGLASHGGFAGVILAVFLYNKRHSDAGFFFFADRLAVLALMFASLIRIGNFFNSEIIGLPSNVPWAVIFTSVDQIPRHPAMLYESIAYFCIFLLLLFLYLKTKMRETEGRLLGAAALISFSARFLLEFPKENQVAFEGFLPINMGQILSIPFIVVGIWLLVRKSKPVISPEQQERNQNKIREKLNEKTSK